MFFFLRYTSLHINKSDQAMAEADYIRFEFTEHETEPKSLSLRRHVLTQTSEYFDAMLNGHFVESMRQTSDLTCVQTLRLSDVSFDTFTIITELLQVEPSGDNLCSLLNLRVSFDACLELIVACDRFFLVDLKDLFISILVCQFLNFSTWSLCFQMAFSLDNSFLAHACVDYLLAKYKLFPMRKSKFFKATSQQQPQQQQQQSPSDFFDEAECETTKPDENVCETAGETELISYEDVFNFLLDSLSEVAPANAACSSSSNSGSNAIKEYLRKILKHALSEIIKNNYWKF